MAAGHGGTTVAHRERRIFARFGEPGQTKAARDRGELVVLVQSRADQSRERLRRTTLAARAVGITIVAATLVALAFSLRSVVIDGLARTADWVPFVESVINDLVFAGSEALVAQAESMAAPLARLKRRATAAGVPTIYANDNFGQWHRASQAPRHSRWRPDDLCQR